MLGADLSGSAWQMQWVRSEQKSVRQFRFIGYQHRCLPASVRLPTQKYAAADARPHQCNDAFQTFAIARGIPRPRWSDGARLPKWQVAAQYQVTSFAENRIQGLQQ